MATLLITYKIKDSEGKITTMPIHYNESTVDSVAKAQGIATSFAPLFAAISGCEIIGAKAEFPLTVPPDAVGTDSGYRVDAGATLSFYNSSGKAVSMYIPGLLLSRMSQSVVDLDDADIQAFTDALTAGTGITGSYGATDGNELDLSSVRAGYQSVRKTRR